MWPQRKASPADRRREMVRLIASRGVRSPALLTAMGDVPREEFVPPLQAHHAYADGPLAIGEGQTISQPYVVALMVDALSLTGRERVLDVGTGSGYAAAIMARLADEVFSIERVPSLAATADRRLRRLGFANVRVTAGDGTLGWPEFAPYDAILVSAGGPRVSETLVDQLAVGGRLVMPIGRHRHQQELVRRTRLSEETVGEDRLGEVSFVPLIGEEGWPD